jgi:hypothetical protein
MVDLRRDTLGWMDACDDGSGCVCVRAVVVGKGGAPSVELVSATAEEGLLGARGAGDSAGKNGGEALSVAVSSGMEEEEDHAPWVVCGRGLETLGRTLEDRSG